MRFLALNADLVRALPQHRFELRQIAARARLLMPAQMHTPALETATARDLPASIRGY